MLEKNIKDFINSRLEYSTKEMYKSTKYINTEENLINLFNEIFNLLPKQKQYLLWQYEDSYSELLTYNVENSYIKGFKDCIKIIYKIFKE